MKEVVIVLPLILVSHGTEVGLFH